MPWFHKNQPVAEIIELRSEKISRIPLLKLVVKALNVIWTIILSQCLTFLNMDFLSEELLSQKVIRSAIRELLTK
jgi:hypothetical protein